MMDLNEKPEKMELKGEEGKEIVSPNGGLERELECCEERNKYMVLELEIEKRKSEFELLKGKFSALETEKVRFEDEVRVLKRRNVELEQWITQFESENNDVGGEKGTGKLVDLTDEEGKVTQLMIENNVLECEKKKAESDTEVWKLRCRELELRVLELEKEISVMGGGQSLYVGMIKPETRRSKESDLKDGSDVVTGSEHLEAENKMANDNETTHAAIGINSACCSPLKRLGDPDVAGTPAIDMPSKQSKQVDSRKRGFVFESEKDHGSRVRKQLAFGEESGLSQKMVPSTPGVARPSSAIIDISDSEDELVSTNVHLPSSEGRPNRMVRVSTDFMNTLNTENRKSSHDNLKRTFLDQSDEENMNGYAGSSPFVSTPKRRRVSNIVTTDSESDGDDNIPICMLRTKRLWGSNSDVVDSYSNRFSTAAPVSEEKVRESSTPRRRLVSLRKRNVKNELEQFSLSNSNNSGADHHSGHEGVEKDDIEEDGSESDSEGESLGGFIVKSSSDLCEGDDGSSASEDVSDANVDFDEVLSRIRRSRDCKLKWEFEADMLAGFGKDLELCMKAVCALYRQQTSEEKVSKGTFIQNQRGFSQCDAFRGTTLAEFLTDGDPKGDLKKTVKELREHDPKGPELCRTLATHYSKQLFAIYMNKEDPLFLPS